MTSASSPDTKAMCTLIEQLEVLKQTESLSSSKSPSKTSSTHSSISKKTKRKSKKHINENQKKSLQNWLISESRQDKKSECMEKNRLAEPPSKHKQKIGSSRKQQATSLYMKYGVKVPSFKSIMKQWKETEEYKKSLENNKLEPITEITTYKDYINNNEIKPKTKVLDCKHLTLKQIRKAVSRNMTYIKKILTGEIHSERQLTYCKEQQRNKDLIVDLRHDISTVTFTDKQIRIMLKMLDRQFEEKAEYYLIVLLPELCLKIFMDVHNMNYEEAVEYLEKRPCIDDSDSD